ncbi:MAG: hypothetical protein HY874_04670 [Chloroflexi bacterium]|nr:hypothetical protein [Chloroflexota bacterium]
MNSIILSGMAWASSIKDAITTRIREERGQDLVEYAVLVGFIGVALAAFFLIAGNEIQWANFRNKINDCVTFDAVCTP